MCGSGLVGFLLRVKNVGRLPCRLAPNSSKLDSSSVSEEQLLGCFLWTRDSTLWSSSWNISAFFSDSSSDMVSGCCFTRGPLLSRFRRVDRIARLATETKPLLTTAPLVA